jgi:hypothetical protein
VDKDHLLNLIDTLWAIWLEENPDVQEDWFSGPPDVMPESISDRYSISVLSDKDAARERKHWLSCGVSIIVSRITSLIKSGHSDVLRDIASELANPTEEIIDDLDALFAARNLEMSRLIVMILDLDLPEQASVPWGFVDDSDLDPEKIIGASYNLQCLLSDCGCVEPHYFNTLKMARIDLEWANACVPGAIRVDSMYTAAPQTFTEWVRTLLGAIGGQVG